MRSLWSGVSGLQAHQVAMDVEGNNIANVNTTGFKYSRANFSDMLSQTAKIATAPQGKSGGKNPMQVGLGTEVGSVTKIFSQGSIQPTNKNTDIAIQGDGFFVMSMDGGKTNQYTRNGDFVFDADGNFVNNKGLIAQGWGRDEKTGEIDNTAPIQNITIQPGLTTPARPTAEINLKANLNSGANIVNKTAIRPLDSTAGINGVDGVANTKDDEKVDDFNVLFTDNGEAFDIKEASVTKNLAGNITGVTGGEGVSVSFDGGATKKEFRYTSDPTLAGTTSAITNAFYFRSTEDLRKGLQDFANDTSAGSTVTVNDQGKYEINNSAGANDLNIQVGAITDGETDENPLFTTAIKSFAGQLSKGSSGSKISQTITAATHAASVDIFDSLGTRHTVKVDFRKAGYVYDTSTPPVKVGASWNVKIQVPKPGDIGGTINTNEIEGQVIFNDDGSLASFAPSSITYTANNGSAPNQTIQLGLGTANQFNGLTSFDSNSSTSGINQDGYTGGDLSGIRIDESGTLIGSFTNGRSFGLAQLAMAKFTNNIGLEAFGNGMYSQTSNSGEPIIGQAGTGGRGAMQSSALEMSNVDLSKSLTQLIVIQRGFQANSKTITTSDQMLNTLLQLKQ